MVVTPPASVRGNCASCGQTECSTHTCAVTGRVASFTSFVCVPGASRRAHRADVRVRVDDARA
jgi:hypothetical protein